MATPNLASYSAPLRTSKKYKLKYSFFTIGSITYSELNETSSISKGSYQFLGKTYEFSLNMQVTGNNIGTISINNAAAKDCTFSESGNTLTVKHGKNTILITKSRRGPVMKYEGYTLKIVA